jgi:hypothetical protein
MLKNPYLNAIFLSFSLIATSVFTAILLPKVVGAQSAITPMTPVDTTPGYIYLSQVPYTGFGDLTKLFGFLVIVGLWSLLIVMFIKADKTKEVVRKMLRNAEGNNGPSAKSGYVFDVAGKQLLNMSMSPVGGAIADAFVPKAFTHTGKSEAREVAVPHDETAYALNSRVSDHSSDVNTFMDLIVRNDESAVFEHLRKMKAKGVNSADFAAAVVLELDAVYRAKLDGEQNKQNGALSQILSNWNRARIEGVIASLLTIVDHSYTDANVGTKVAVMRIMKSA